MKLINWTLTSCVSVVTLCICLLFIICQPLRQTESSLNEQTKNSDTKVIGEEKLITLNDIQQARNKWLSKKIVDYQMVVRFMPHGALTPASPVIITVRNNETVSIKPVSEKDTRPTFQYSMFETMDKMFDTITEDLGKEAKVKGSFHSEFGYPKEVTVQYRGMNVIYGLYIDKFDVVNKY